MLCIFIWIPVGESEYGYKVAREDVAIKYPPLLSFNKKILIP